MDSADRALAILSHHASMRLEQFAKASAACAVPVDGHRAAKNLSLLGHAEIDWIRRTIEASPPTLAMLPLIGRPIAVLAGARTPNLIARLEDHQGLTVTRERLDPAAPTRITLQGTRAKIDAAAKELQIHHDSRPASHRLAAAAPTVHAYAEALPWRNDGRPKGASYYDTQTLSFTATTGHVAETPGPFPHRVPCFAIDGNRRAPCDRDWARHWALARDGRTTCDLWNSSLRVHMGAPLPPILARSATLCTGRLPRREGSHLVYDGMPPGLGRLILSKLEPKVTT